MEYKMSKYKVGDKIKYKDVVWEIIELDSDGDYLVECERGGHTHNEAWLCCWVDVNDNITLEALKGRDSSNFVEW
jgi:hypothetical protein